jgi:hypothetical protein
MIAGLIGYLFFGHYRGEMISSPLLYLIGSIGSFLIGLLLRLTSKTKKEINAETGMANEIARLKANGERILLNFDNCEFRTNSYQEEIQNEREARSYDVLFNQDTPIATKDVIQSSLAYINKTGDIVEKFNSPLFPVSEVSLKASVLNGQVWLYVDRFNRSKYHFEIK